MAGVGLVLAIFIAFALTSAFYNRAFSHPLKVTLTTPRIGLVMDPGNKVKYRGVEIGRVADVRRKGAGAELILELDRDLAARIPANALVAIQSSTVFGAKYVELDAPTHASTARLTDGAVLASGGVTTEVNTVFNSLDRVLRSIDVADLNTTLTVLARALDRRGDSIADLARKADQYLTKFEPLLPQLRRDLVEAARFARLGIRVSPAFLSVLDNATVTARTVVTRRQALDRLLVDLSLLGDSGAKLIGVNRDALVDLLRRLRPTAETLRVYSSEMPCFFQGLEHTHQIMAKTFGATDPGLRAIVSLRSELPPYTPARDLPGLARGRGPDCSGLPVLSAAQVPFPERGGPQ
jgi:phospholipid/cholesterol/gamma-HCH transport system substrate-binding protein